MRSERGDDEHDAIHRERRDAAAGHHEESEHERDERGAQQDDTRLVVVPCSPGGSFGISRNTTAVAATITIVGAAKIQCQDSPSASGPATSVRRCPRR